MNTNPRHTMNVYTALLFLIFYCDPAKPQNTNKSNETTTSEIKRKLKTTDVVTENKKFSSRTQVTCRKPNGKTINRDIQAPGKTQTAATNNCQAKANKKRKMCIDQGGESPRVVCNP